MTTKTLRILVSNEVTQVIKLSEEQSRRFENYLRRNSCSDSKEKSSVTSDNQSNSASISVGQQRSSPSTSDNQSNLPSISDGEKRSSPSTSDNQSNLTSISVGQQKSSPSTSDNQRAPSIYGGQKTSSPDNQSTPSISGDQKRSSPDDQRNSSSISDGQKRSSPDDQRNSSSISDGQKKSSPDDQRNSSSISDGQKRSSPSSSDSQRNPPSTSEGEFPRWGATAKRGRKSSSTSAAATHSSDNQKEPVFGEKELVDTLMHLWTLSIKYSLDSAKKDRRIADKKRKFKDTNIVHYKEDGLKKARIENDEIMLDSAKKTVNLEATHKQIPILPTAGFCKFSCGNCGKSFSCHQALGGHKSTCNSNFSIREVGESSLQGLMRNKNPATSKGGPHECSICGKAFPNGCALGGHKRSHRTGQVEPGRRSSVSPPKEITKDTLHLMNSFTPSVPEVQDESLHLLNSFKSSVPEAQENAVADKKIMFDLNRSPPKDEGELPFGSKKDEDEFDESGLLCLEEPNSVLDI